MQFRVFWNVAPCSYESPWWWRQYAPLKRRSTYTWLHSSTSQKTLNCILAAVRSWNLTHCLPLQSWSEPWSLHDVTTENNNVDTIWECEVDASGLGQWPVMGCCLHGNELPDYIKCEGFLDHLRDSVPWIQFHTLYETRGKHKDIHHIYVLMLVTVKEVRHKASHTLRPLLIYSALSSKL
jgi:hypothetical protein